MPRFKFGKGFMVEDDGIEEEKKTAFMSLKTEQKGKLSMDPMVESSWKSKDYSTLVEESTSLVGKSMGMLEITSGGFTAQVTGVGQMELEAPS